MIKSCPFCGNEETPHLIANKTVVRMYTDQVSDEDINGGCYVICDASRNTIGGESGCGSMSGWGATEEKAKAIWNRRT